MLRSLSLIFLLCIVFPGKAQTSGNIGITINIFNPGSDSAIAYISSVGRSSPAAKAGLYAGDIILTINGKETQRQSSAALAKATAGVPGSTVTLNIMRFGVNKSVAVKRTVSTAKNKPGNTALLPAVDSIKLLNVSSLYQFTDSCLVGDCSKGTGMYLWKDSVLMLGNYTDEKPNGLMQMLAPDRYEESQYNNNIRQGRSQVWLKNKTHFLMFYVDGKIHGIVTQTDPDGTVYESVYNRGNMVSTRVVSDPTGKESYKKYERLRKKMEDEVIQNGRAVVHNRYFTVMPQHKTETSFFSSKNAGVTGYHVLIIYPRLHGSVAYALNPYMTRSGGDKKLTLTEKSNDPCMGYFYTKVPHYPSVFYNIIFDARGLENAYAKILVVEY